MEMNQTESLSGLRCESCGQTLYYESRLAKGNAVMLMKMARFVKEKGINVFHMRKEMLENDRKWITASEFENRAHMVYLGLIAYHGEQGNYVITRRGYDFLAGKAVPRIAFLKKLGVDKDGEGKVVGHSEETVTIDKFDKEWGPWWHVNGFDVKEGRVITEL